MSRSAPKLAPLVAAHELAHHERARAAGAERAFREELRAHYQAGTSVIAIARALGISRTRVYALLAKEE
jgi:DNA invertase Pin-like site-specific DNA recombinase